ncbi:MAG: anthrone oxygenase family protein [Dongiaceae bacterium]
MALVAVGLAMVLGHALELPGKLRLPRETYIAVQSIYYPGFTIGAVFGEFGAMVATLVLAIVTPFGGADFWLTLVAFVSLLIMHGLYWVLIHPVNKFWLKDQQLQGAGAAFFGIGGRDAPGGPADQDWTALRDRWEYAHVARAVFAILSLVLLATAAAV